MRIGIIIGKFDKETCGGGGTFQTAIYKALRETKSHHEFYFLYEDNKNLDKNLGEKLFNIAQKKSPFRSITRLFKKKKKSKAVNQKLNQIISENNIELLWYITPIFYSVKIPYVITVWDLQHRLQTFFPEVSVEGFSFDKREQFYKNAILKSAYTVIGNQEGANQIEKFYNFPRERIKTIGLPVPQYVFEEKEDDSILSQNNLSKNSYLFYPAQFWAHKNHIRLLKALVILKKQNHQFKLVFSGFDHGNENYVRSKVKELGLENDVKFLGFVSKAQIISLYKNAFALTFPSMFGPDNLPPLEAMALGCPVICSNAPGMEEQLQDAALFFNPLDEKDLAQKILLLQNDQKLKNSLQQKGLELIKIYNCENYVNKMITIIDEFMPIREMWK